MEIEQTSPSLQQPPSHLRVILGLIFGFAVLLFVFGTALGSLEDEWVWYAAATGVQVALFALFLFRSTKKKAFTVPLRFLTAGSITLLGLPSIITIASSGEELAIVISLFMVAPFMLVLTWASLPLSITIAKSHSRRALVIALVGTALTITAAASTVFGGATSIIESADERAHLRAIRSINDFDTRVAECGTLSSVYRSDCISEAAQDEYRKTKDPKYCYDLPGGFGQYSCMKLVVQETGDISHCEYLKYGKANGWYPNCIQLLK